MNACRVNQRLVLAFAAGVFALLLATWLILPAQAVRADLPPRPTPRPTVPPEPAWETLLVSVAAIELRVRFGQEGQARHWQEMWTVVEWQDAFGDWHEVEGWRGTFDEFVDGEGRKVWWVYRRDLGTGPFRWAVYMSPAGELLAHSESFHLPGAAGQRVEVSVTLEPDPHDCPTMSDWQAAAHGMRAVHEQSGSDWRYPQQWPGGVESTCDRR